jgi:hypothetical protein
MNQVLYLTAFVLLAAGASIGDKIDRGHIVNQPLNPIPLRVFTGAAGLAGIAWFVYGFFFFTWWLPIAGIIAFVFIGSFIIFHALRSYRAPLIGMLASVAGFALAVCVLINGS